MSINQPLPWQSEPQGSYSPILLEGELIGICKADYARRLVDTLNDEDKYRRALRLACYDLIARSGASTDSVHELMQQYLVKTERPKRGTGVIALMLRERQEDLDLSDEEFAKFCDSYRLSRNELKQIYAGVEIESDQLAPLSRILGISIDEVIEAWKGN